MIQLGIPFLPTKIPGPHAHFVYAEVERPAKAEIKRLRSFTAGFSALATASSATKRSFFTQMGRAA